MFFSSHQLSLNSKCRNELRQKEIELANICIDLANLVSKITNIQEQGDTSVVDFVREKPINVTDLAGMLNRSPVTVRRWFAKGLEHARLGGTVYTTLEALNRFSRPGESTATIQVSMDRETLAAIKSLKQQGITFGTETSRDGRSQKVGA